MAQVAASIETKHRNTSSIDGTGSPYRYAAGQAFKAARRRSYIQLRKDTINSTEMQEVTRMLEGSPRKMANRLQTRCTQALDRQQGPRVPPRRQSSAALRNHNHHHRHHRVHSYQALLDVQRPSTSLEGSNSHSNTNTHSSTRSRSSHETVRPTGAADHRNQRFLRKIPSTRHVSPRMKFRQGLKGGGSLDMGPRLQRSTSGLGFDDTSGEIFSAGS